MNDQKAELVEPYYGLPAEVVFCRKCVMSNQRPRTAVEFQNRNVKESLEFNAEGVCSACQYSDMKWNEIDWEARKVELEALLETHRRSDGRYDVIVPGSGGKDSMYAAHTLKHKYGMHPLTVTWAPHRYTEIGWRNFQAWIDCGFDNQLFTPNGQVHRRLTRLAFLNLLHPFQPFILGQKQIAVKVAMQHGVRLVMYGESPAETGSGLEFAKSSRMPPEFYSVPRVNQWDIVLGGRTIDQLLADRFTRGDLLPYVPSAHEDVEAAGIEYHFFGYFEHWRPQDKFYYASENCGFTPNPERTEGTYSKMISLDDRIDGLHYYTTYIKFGLGRATYEASRDVRDRFIERDEAVRLVHRYDGEFPKRYFQEILDYLNIDEEIFWETIDGARSPHLWKKVDNQWILRHRVE